MIKFIKLFTILVLSIVLLGCDTKPDFDVDHSKEPGSDAAKIMEQGRGEIVHGGVYATSITSKSTKLSEGAYTFGILMDAPNKQRVMVTVGCVAELGESGIVHTVLDNDGKEVTGESTISIMKYRKGIKDIREMDEQGKPFFSLANGDTDFVDALSRIKTLDKDTPLAFTIETMASDGYSYTVAWSPLVKAGDLAKAIDRLPLKYCANMPLSIDNPEVVQGFSNESLRNLGKQQRAQLQQ